jgi:hypothetical protein
MYLTWLTSAAALGNRAIPTISREETNDVSLEPRASRLPRQTPSWIGTPRAEQTNQSEQSSEFDDQQIRLACKKGTQPISMKTMVVVGLCSFALVNVIR